jgi:hypothetical protein
MVNTEHLHYSSPEKYFRLGTGRTIDKPNPPKSKVVRPVIAAA